MHGVHIQRQLVINLRFADDIALLAESNEVNEVYLYNINHQKTHGVRRLDKIKNIRNSLHLKYDIITQITQKCLCYLIRPYHEDEPTKAHHSMEWWKGTA